MHLVLGIILIIILLGWSGVDKINAAANRAEREEREKNDPYIQWVKQNTDPVLEKQIWEEWNPFGEEATLIYQRLINEAAIPQHRTQDSSLKEIREVKLAQCGKLPLEFAKNGIAVIGNCTFAKWYDKELRKNGFKDKMYFIKQEQVERLRWDDTSTIIPVDETPEYNVGTLFWLPMKNYTRYY